MGLDHFKLFRRQPRRLQEDGVRNADLADIMQGGSPGDGVYLALGKPVFWEVLLHIFQQDSGEIFDAADVFAGLRTPELHHGTQGINHELVVVLNLLLVGQNLHLLLFETYFHIALVLIQFHNIVGPALYNVRVKRLMYHIGDTVSVGPVLAVANGLAGDQDHGKMLNHILGLHIFQHTKTVHLRHHDIQQNQHQITVFLNPLDGLTTVAGLDEVVLVLEQVLQYGPVHFLIVHNQDLLSLHPGLVHLFLNTHNFLLVHMPNPHKMY